MRPKRVPTSNFVLQLPGGNEDNDLWAERSSDGTSPVIISVWELDDDDRAAIANGGTVELWTWGTQHPPVTLQTGASVEQRKALADGA